MSGRVGTSVGAGTPTDARRVRPPCRSWSPPTPSGSGTPRRRPTSSSNFAFGSGGFGCSSSAMGSPSTCRRSAGCSAPIRRSTTRTSSSRRRWSSPARRRSCGSSGSWAGPDPDRIGTSVRRAPQRDGQPAGPAVHPEDAGVLEEAAEPAGGRVDVPSKHVAYFKPGKELEELINREPGQAGPAASPVSMSDAGPPRSS